MQAGKPYFTRLIVTADMSQTENIALQKKGHKGLQRLFYTLLFLGMLLPSIPTASAQKKGKSGAKKNSFVLVLDAGHGGKDTGAVGNGGREKDINLKVALATGEIIKKRYPEVKVLYTRSDDTFIGLQQRANFANRNKANLFMSVHTNSAQSSSAAGTETYVLGLWRTEDNLRVAMKENESILLEDNYERTYQGFDPSSSESYIMFEMMQNVHQDKSIRLAQAVQGKLAKLPTSNRGVRQAGFLVIRETAMPSILIEVGFISNKKEAEFLLSSDGQNRLAQAIADGFASYYEAYNKSSSL